MTKLTTIATRKQLEKAGYEYTTQSYGSLQIWRNHSKPSIFLKETERKRLESIAGWIILN